jgi:hypothetical protein
VDARTSTCDATKEFVVYINDFCRVGGEFDARYAQGCFTYLHIHTGVYVMFFFVVVQKSMTRLHGGTLSWRDGMLVAFSWTSFRRTHNKTKSAQTCIHMKARITCYGFRFIASTQNTTQHNNFPVLYDSAQNMDLAYAIDEEIYAKSMEKSALKNSIVELREALDVLYQSAPSSNDREKITADTRARDQAYIVVEGVLWFMNTVFRQVCMSTHPVFFLSFL